MSTSQPSARGSLPRNPHPFLLLQMVKRRGAHEPSGPHEAPREHRDRDRRLHHDDHDHTNPFYIFMAFNVFLGLALYGVYYVVQNPPVIISCEASQPLVKVTDNFLDNNVFSKLSKCLEEHPLVLGNELDDSNFKGTRGFVIKFSEEGISDFRSHRYFECLSPYFDAIRLPRTNAFVMNLLICELSDGNNPDRVAVGLHLDKKIGINSWRHFLAHQVNVLYAMVPNDMVGGQLHVFPYENGYPSSGDEPEHKVTPQLNRLVAFKGNAYHRVMQFKTTSNVTRVSLVLEQYQVPEAYKSQLIVSSFERRTGIMMM